MTTETPAEHMGPMGVYVLLIHRNQSCSSCWDSHRLVWHEDSQRGVYVDTAGYFTLVGYAFYPLILSIISPRYLTLRNNMLEHIVT